MHICLINFDAAWKDKVANIKKKELLIQQALIYHPETDIIVFPELSLTGYVLDTDAGSLAEEPTGSSIQAMSAIAKKYGVNIIFGFIEKNGQEKPYNSIAVLSKTGELITTYRKNHLFTQWVEPDIYTAGSSLSVCMIEWWKCGLSICFDLRYPRLYEAYRKAGVECVFTPAAWVDGRNKPDIFHSLAKARSGENQFFMACVDSLGTDRNNTYAGNALVSNPYCENVAETLSDIFHFAHIEKSDMITLAQNMPLSSGYRERYTVL